jgi:hypothetical protein
MLLPPEPTIAVNPVEEYAKGIGLSTDYIAILKPLGYDKRLDDSDKTAVDAANSILSILAVKRIHELGLNENVANYVSSVASLPDKAFAKYALENALCIQDRQLTELESNFLKSPDTYSQQLSDYYLNEIDKINPELGKEIRKVPDFKTANVKSVEALEDVLGLAGNPKYKTAFDKMLNVGIKEKRKYCSPLEGLEWLAEDMDFDNKYNNPMENYMLELFMGRAWKRPVHDIDSWSFEEATDRVNSPELCAIFDKTVMNFVSYGGEKYSPREAFESEGKEVNCADHARLNEYFLVKNGYEKYTSNSKKSNSCCVLEVVFDKFSPEGTNAHDVCLYTTNEGKIYYIDVRGAIRGSFETAKDAAMNIAKENNENMTMYILKN